MSARTNNPQPFDATLYRSIIEQTHRESIAKLPPAAKKEANEKFTLLVERSVKALEIRYALSKNQSLSKIEDYAAIVANDVLMAVVIAHHPNALMGYIADLQPRLKPELSKQLQFAKVTLTPEQRAETILVATHNFYQHVLSGAYVPEAAGCITVVRRFIAVEIKAITGTLPIPDNYQAPSSQEPSKLPPEIVTALEALVAQLPSPYREAITMRFSGGMSTKEIAEALGKTENNTRQIIYRGLNKLKEKDTTGLLQRAFDQMKQYGLIRLVTLLVIAITLGILARPLSYSATVVLSQVANTATGQIQSAKNNGAHKPQPPKQLPSSNHLIPASSNAQNSQNSGNDSGKDSGEDQPIAALPSSSIPDDTQKTNIPLKPTNTPVSSPLPDKATPTRQAQGNVPQSTAIPTPTYQNSAESPLPTQPSQLAEPTAVLPTSIQSATSLPITTNTPAVTSQPTADGIPVPSSMPTNTPGNSGASPIPTNTPVPSSTPTSTPGNTSASPMPTNTPVPSSTPTSTPGNSGASPTATSTPGNDGETPTPTATALPTATSTPTVTPCPPDQYQSLDITLVMDISGSMLDEDKLTYAKAAATKFASLLEPQDQLALVVFRNSADLRQPLTLDHQKVIAQIEKLEAGGNTSISAGINTATEELTSTRHRPDARAVMILLTDGLAKDSLEEAQTAAGTAKEHDIRLIAIGFGTPNSPFLDATFLQNLVSSKADYHEVQDVNELTNVYESIRVLIHTCDSSPIDSGSELSGSPTPTPTIQPQLPPITTTASLTESTALIWNTWFPVVSSNSLTASSAESTSRLTMAALLVALPVAYQTSNKGGSMTTITLSVPAEEIVQQSEVDDYEEQKNRSRNNALLQNQRKSQNNLGKKTNSLHSHWHNRGPPRVLATIVSTDVMLYGKNTAANQSLQLLWAAQIEDYAHYQHLFWWLPLCLLQYNATSVLHIQTAISSSLGRVYRYLHNRNGSFRKEYLSHQATYQRFCSHRCNYVECAWRYIEYGIPPPLLTACPRSYNSPQTLPLI